MNPVKPLVEWALLRVDPGWRTRSRIRGRALILAYHNIVPDGSDDWADPALHLPQGRFAEQLDLLARTADVVPLQQILTGRRSEGRPLVAITFDDAYQGAVTLGAGLLVDRKLPATFFVAPGRLDGQSFWWDAIRGRDGGSLEPGARDYILDRLGGKEDRAQEWAREHAIIRDVPLVGRTASVREVVGLAGAPGLSLGSHSWSHPNLAALRGEDLERELRAPLEWLRETTGKSAAVLAYPFGRSSPEVHRAAGAAGYEAGLAISGGWLGGDAPLCLPRLNVPRGLSIRGLALRLKGLLAGDPS